MKNVRALINQTQVPCQRELTFFEQVYTATAIEHTLCSYLHQAEDIEDIVDSQDAVVHSHQTTQPGGGGDQQQQEGVPNSSTGQKNTQKKRWIHISIMIMLPLYMQDLA